ncbi:MAG: U32 family peptidase [Nanoarchaeota archaeon]|nr:U32 family peptidase [Nanoarchaeota archaeon]
MENYELLAPAGDFSMLSAAVKAGADAVYFGMQNDFNMRAAAKNFKISELDEMRKICDSSERKVKMYLTLNTIVYNDELDKLKEIIKEVKGKVDAVICWDLAVIQLCKKYGVPFHISTQASISNLEAAKFYKDLGAERIVLAREVNLKQAKEISKEVETEMFCHGAMCVAISGRCFMSQHLFNSSANRGKCLHPCRRPYEVTIKDETSGKELRLENQRVLSAKDLCTLPFIEEMKKAGVTSFKIEGRNRDARYVSSVVSVYRKALDEKLSKKEIEDALKELETVYNRGFSSGFYLGLPTPDDFAKIENSGASERKIYVGKITHYYDKPKTASLKIEALFVKTGDKIAIIGNTTGIEQFNLESVYLEDKQVEFAKKGDEVAIKVPSRVRENDAVYKIISVKNSSA